MPDLTTFLSEPTALPKPPAEGESTDADLATQEAPLRETPQETAAHEAASEDAPVSQRALERLEQLIREKMPITEHLAFSLSWTASGLVATAPLEANRNHADTVFGGSLSMLATLTGWATVQLVLQEAKEAAQVVIQESCIEYLKPVRDDFSMMCAWPDEDTIERFRATLHRWGRARLSLCCCVGQDCDQAVTYEAQYVALRGGDEV